MTECVPKFASNCVAMLTAGGLPVAFCTTRNSLVTISITCPVWNTKSPFRLTASELRHPGMFGWDFSSRVGDDWNKTQLFTRAFGLQIWLALLALDQNTMPSGSGTLFLKKYFICVFFVNLDWRYCVFKSLGIILPLGRGTLRCHQSRDSETTWISQLREPCNEKITLLLNW